MLLLASLSVVQPVFVQPIITTYYCVILKMVILHDEMKTIRIGFLCVF